MNYGKVLSKAVHRKWPTDSQKEWWWTKFSAARRVRTARLSEAQNHRCAFCGVLTYLSEADFQPGMSRKRHLATLEHVTPQSEGGTDSPQNCVMSCDECNRLRGTMDAWQFWEVRNDPKAWLAWLKRRPSMQSSPKTGRLKSEEERERRRQQISFNMAVACLLDPDFKARFDVAMVMVEEAMANYAITTAKETRRKNGRRELLRRAQAAVGDGQ